MQKSIQDDIVVQNVNEGEIFGINSFFSCQPRLENARSHQSCTLYKLKRKEFLEIVQKGQNDYEIFNQLKDQIAHFSEIDTYRNKMINLTKEEQEQYQQQQQEFNQSHFYCKICYENSHNFKQCGLVHYIPNRQKMEYERKAFSCQPRISQDRKVKFLSKKNALLSIDKCSEAIDQLFNNEYTMWDAMELRLELERSEESESSDDESESFNSPDKPRNDSILHSITENYNEDQQNDSNTNSQLDASQDLGESEKDEQSKNFSLQNIPIPGQIQEHLKKDRINFNIMQENSNDSNGKSKQKRKKQGHHTSKIAASIPLMEIVNHKRQSLQEDFPLVNKRGSISSEHLAVHHKRNQHHKHSDITMHSKRSNDIPGLPKTSSIQDELLAKSREKRRSKNSTLLLVNPLIDINDNMEDQAQNLHQPNLNFPIQKQKNTRNNTIIKSNRRESIKEIQININPQYLAQQRRQSLKDVIQINKNMASKSLMDQLSPQINQTLKYQSFQSRNSQSKLFKSKSSNFTSEFKEIDLMNFDQLRNYRFYMPWNNYKELILKISQELQRNMQKLESIVPRDSLKTDDKKNGRKSTTSANIKGLRQLKNQSTLLNKQDITAIKKIQQLNKSSSQISHNDGAKSEISEIQ